MSEGQPAASTVTERLSLTIGDRTHRVVGRILAHGVPATRPGRVALTLTMTQEVLAEHPVEHPRTRAASIEIATMAATYLHRFLLDAAWVFDDAEAPLGSGRADLVFRNETINAWLVDEMKTSRGREDETSLRPQIDRYLLGGAERWGMNYIGVRLCALAQPRHSRLYVPTSKRSVALVDTELAGGVG
jgi:hypothetical protein